MDRVLASSKDGNQYLVKWQGSSYAEATWEYEKDLKDDTKIKEFLEREKSVPTEVKDFKRPQASAWKKFLESPTYRNENQLREYQLQGLNWLTFCWLNQRNSILADEMGLGKTVQTVSVINYIHNVHSCRGPFLIVAPLSTIPHWKREFENWTTLNTIVYHGNSQARDILRKYEWKYDKCKLNNVYKFNVLITTYEMIMTDSTILNKLNWVYLAIDEAHRLKNKNCKLIGVLKTFKFDHLLLLTGTPLQNNTQELWTLLNFMDKNSFNSLDKFLKEFGELKETEQVEKLHTILRPYLLRRMKEDVEKSIAPKEETIIEVELTGIQKKYYRAIYDKNFESLNTGAKSSNFPSLLNVMMQLRKCCNHPYLIKGVEDHIIREEGKNSDINLLMVKASGKLVLIDKLLPKLKNGGHKVLIFSQMVKMLDILEDYMHFKGYIYERIDGTKRASERQEAIDRFSVKGSDRFIFLLGTRAGGLGINLTAADTCIIYDSDWNPQNDLQAQARCHRIGQTQMVKIYRLITRNTYESIMFDKASRKLGLDKAVLTKMKGVNGKAESEAPLNIKDRKEIDLLLKLGAYAFKDTNEESKYDEEDIDKILERSTRVVTTSDSNVPSSFSKASFVSEGAASNADLDVNDPDFWIKIMPEKANKVNNPLIQERPRTRKFVTRFNEDDDDDISGSDAEDYEDEKEDNSKGWTFRERARLKFAILEYGYGQWKTVKRVAQLNWTTAEIKKYTDVLLRKCITFLGEEVAPTMGLYEYYINEPSEPEPIVPETTNTTGDDVMVIEEETFENDPTLSGPSFEDYKQRNAKLIVRRLEGIARVCKTILDFCTEFGTEFTIPEVRDGPTSWWTVDDDKSLVLGTFYHGYGKYENMKEDTQLGFYAKFATCEKKEDEKPTITPVVEGENVTEIIKIENEATVLAESIIKKEKSNEEENGEGEGEKEEACGAFGWPSAKLFNRRLRKLNRYLVTTQSTKEKLDKIKEKEVEKQRIKDEKQKKREELWLEWSKREKLDFYRTIVTHGIPILENGDYDWEFIKQKAKLTRKTISNIKEYCEGLIAYSQNCIKKGAKPNDKAVKEEIAEEKENEKEDESGDQNLTIAQCKRLLMRIHLFKELREKIIPNGELLPVLLKTASRPANLPLWWKPEIHDHYLILGINKHGFGQWERICTDPQLPFFALASSRLKLIESENSDAEDDIEEMNIDEGDEEGEEDENGEKVESTANNNNNNNNKSKKGPGNAKKKETSSVSGPYSTILDFPKDKIVLKRLDTLIKFITTAKEKYNAKVTAQQQQKKKKQTSIKDFGKPIVKSKRGSTESSNNLTNNGSNSENKSNPLVKKKTTSSPSLASKITPKGDEGTAGKADPKKSKKRARSPAPPKKLAIKKLQDIPFHPNGTPVLPITIGKMRIEALGVIEYEKPAFHNDRYIWPVGYRSVRSYRSFKNPDVYCEYTSEIVDAGDHPEFVVTAEDAKDDPSIANSPTAAWSNILKKVSEKMEEKNGKRAFNTVSGPEFFGLANGTICKVCFIFLLI